MVKHKGALCSSIKCTYACIDTAMSTHSALACTTSAGLHWLDKKRADWRTGMECRRKKPRRGGHQQMTAAMQFCDDWILDSCHHVFDFSSFVLFAMTFYMSLSTHTRPPTKLSATSRQVTPKVNLFKEIHHSITIGLSLHITSKRPYLKKPITASENKKPFQSKAT